MPAPRSCVAIAALVALAACGGRPVQIDSGAAPVANRWNAVLGTPADLAGALQVRGTGWLGASDDMASTQASVRIENAPPGGRHPWHVHRGRCGADGGIVGSPSSYEPLEVGGDGRASEEAKLAMTLPTGGEYFINVHASEQNLGTIVACGNLAPPSR